MYPIWQKYTTSMKTFIFTPLIKYFYSGMDQFSDVITRNFHPHRPIPHTHPSYAQHSSILSQSINNALESPHNLSSFGSLTNNADQCEEQKLTSFQNLLSDDEEDAIKSIVTHNNNTKLNQIIQNVHYKVLLNKYKSFYSTNIEITSSRPNTPSDPSTLIPPPVNPYFLPFPVYSMDLIDNLTDLWLSHASTHYEPISTLDPLHAITNAPNTTAKGSSTTIFGRKQSPNQFKYFIQHEKNPFSITTLLFKRLKHLKELELDKYRQHYLNYRLNNLNRTDDYDDYDNYDNIHHNRKIHVNDHQYPYNHSNAHNFDSNNHNNNPDSNSNSDSDSYNIPKNNQHSWQYSLPMDQNIITSIDQNATPTTTSTHDYTPDAVTASILPTQISNHSSILKTAFTLIPHGLNTIAQNTIRPQTSFFSNILSYLPFYNQQSTNLINSKDKPQYCSYKNVNVQMITNRDYYTNAHIGVESNQSQYSKFLSLHNFTQRRAKLAHFRHSSSQ